MSTAHPVRSVSDTAAWVAIYRALESERRDASREVRAGPNLILSPAAGFDTRPYHMELPESLQWVEVGLPDLIAHKEDVRRGERPACRLARIRLDLSEGSARRKLFAEPGHRAERVTVASEGLLVYLSRDAVCVSRRRLSPRLRAGRGERLSGLPASGGRERGTGHRPVEPAPRAGSRPTSILP
jgi:O-methyltransferase involved in polyketide biosynthesis